VKASRRWRRRNGEERSQQWGARRREVIRSGIEVVPRQAFGRVDPSAGAGELEPVAWFSDGKRRGEILEDGTTRVTSS
jgi:hypothetical protein